MRYLLIILMCIGAKAATVTGLVQQVTGVNYSTNVVFNPMSTPTVNGNVVLASPKQTVILTNGAFTVNLLNGDYDTQIGSPRDRFIISVPIGSDGLTFNWKDLIVSKVVYTTRSVSGIAWNVRTNGVIVASLTTTNTFIKVP